MSLRVLLSNEQIQTRIKELEAQIDSDYPESGTLTLVCILKGAFVFLADLAGDSSRYRDRIHGHIELRKGQDQLR